MKNAESRDKALSNLTTGVGNTAIGYEAGDTLTTASNSILIGYLAGHGYLVGSNNVVVGNGSFEGAGGPSITGNVVIGNGSTVTEGGTFSNSVMIGNAVDPTGTGGGGEVCIGG